jgi:putative ABC transport system permease protein
MAEGSLAGAKEMLLFSLADYWHEKLLSICAVLALASVLTPLLVLLGVRSGVVETMTARLLENPRNLELRPVGAGRWPREWVAELGQQPEAAFAVPQTRQIAATLSLSMSEDHRSALQLDMAPTGAGDPLLACCVDEAPSDAEIVLTESAARKLGASTGDAIYGRLGRRREGGLEYVDIALRTAGVLPVHLANRDEVFVSLALLEAAEDYRDGFGAPLLGVEGPEPPFHERTFPGFRAYAAGLDQVAVLRDHLADQGVDVHTQAEAIETVRSLDRAITMVFTLIAVVVGVGMAATIASSHLASVARKRRQLGMARLIGHRTGGIMLFPIFQAALTCIFGTAAAAAAALGLQAAINNHFEGAMRSGDLVCRLTWPDGLMVFAAAMAASILASSLAAVRIARIQPAEVIRDG